MNKINLLRVIKSLLTCVMFLTLSTASQAEETASSSEYLQPNELTQDDYAMITDHKARYNDCLNEKAFSAAQSQNDPRIAVDTAMKSCAVILEELDQRMTDRNILPDFRHGYIKRVSSDGANSVLRTVMMGMANRNSPEEN